MPAAPPRGLPVVGCWLLLLLCMLFPMLFCFADDDDDEGEGDKDDEEEEDDDDEVAAQLLGQNASRLLGPLTKSIQLNRKGITKACW